MIVASIAILDIEPKTLQGAAALLRYALGHIDRYDGEMIGWPDRLLPSGVVFNYRDTAKSNDVRSPEYFLMQKVAAALERLQCPAKVAPNIAALGASRRPAVEVQS